MTTAAAPAPVSASSERGVPLPLRSDTFFGICEAIGQDLGFNPNWLRFFFAVLLLWNPEVTLAAYFGLGAVVAATRFFFPEARPAVVADSERGVAADEPAIAAKVEGEKELLAA
jgi:phage shock protein C